MEEALPPPMSDPWECLLELARNNLAWVAAQGEVGIRGSFS